VDLILLLVNNYIHLANSVSYIAYCFFLWQHRIFDLRIVTFIAAHDYIATRSFIKFVEEMNLVAITRDSLDGHRWFCAYSYVFGLAF